MNTIIDMIRLARLEAAKNDDLRLPPGFIPSRQIGSLCGMPVLLNSLCESHNMVPVRAPKTKNKRIAKKWLKRYGTKKEYTFLRMGNTLVMHPETWTEILKNVATDTLPMFNPDMLSGKKATAVILDDAIADFAQQMYRPINNPMSILNISNLF